MALLVAFSEQSLKNHRSHKCQTPKVRADARWLGRGHRYTPLMLLLGSAAPWMWQPSSAGLQQQKELNGKDESAFSAPLESPRKEAGCVPAISCCLSCIIPCLLPCFLNYFSFSSTTLGFYFRTNTEKDNLLLFFIVKNTVPQIYINKPYT